MSNDDDTMVKHDYSEFGHVVDLRWTVHLSEVLYMQKMVEGSRPCSGNGLNKNDLHI